jgi:hypothetical protein
MSLISIIFLTQEELRELTDLKIPKAQMRWLTNHAYPYEVSAAGKPKVLRSIVFNRLSIANHSSNISEPNFDVIR